MMNEIKIIQRKFGCISTSLDDGTLLPLAAKHAIIESWKPTTEKIRVFGSSMPISSGISIVKSQTIEPSLRSIFQDFYLGIRSKGPLVLCPPAVEIRPLCIQLTEYAASKNMGITWMFIDGDKGAQYPTLFGLTPSVVKILQDETPEDVYFRDGEWQEWLFKWMKKYMQPHRVFSAGEGIGLINRPPIITEFKNSDLIEDFGEPINVYEKMGESVVVDEIFHNPDIITPPKKRGRKPKVIA